MLQRRVQERKKELKNSYTLSKLLKSSIVVSVWVTLRDPKIYKHKGKKRSYNADYKFSFHEAYITPEAAWCCKRSRFRRVYL